MPPTQPLQLNSPAKVNLALSVGAPSPAGAPNAGMHPIASWMVALSFSDSVALDPLADGQASRFTIRFDQTAGPAHGREVDWPLEKDLAFRAHGLIEQHVGRPLPVMTTIDKRIPTGAGLGGGSSNAAAMLTGLNRLFDLGLTADDLCDLGRRLGSDVPFFVRAILGDTSALVTGFGETIRPFPLTQPIHLTVIFPQVACPTGPVYQAFDTLAAKADAAPAADPSAVRRLAEASPLPVDGPFNDLAAAAFDIAPTLEADQRRVSAALGLPVHVTGSGSTLFVVAPDSATATRLAGDATRQTGLPALATRSI